MIKVKKNKMNSEHLAIIGSVIIFVIFAAVFAVGIYMWVEYPITYPAEIVSNSCSTTSERQQHCDLKVTYTLGNTKYDSVPVSGRINPHQYQVNDTTKIIIPDASDPKNIQLAGPHKNTMVLLLTLGGCFMFFMLMIMIFFLYEKYKKKSSVKQKQQNIDK